MTTIRNLISAWVLALVGSLLLPLASLAAVSCTTYDAPYTTTTASATIVQHATAVESVGVAETSLRSMASDQGRSLFGLSCSLVAPNNTTLYRAVKPDELADIQATGQLRNLGSAEGKYFTSSAEAASDYAQQAVKAFKDPPYTIVETQVPTKLLPKPVDVDGGIPAYVVPDEVLPQLTPNVLPSMPIPGAP